MSRIKIIVLVMVLLILAGCGAATSDVRTVVADNLPTPTPRAVDDRCLKLPSGSAEENPKVKETPGAQSPGNENTVERSPLPSPSVLPEPAKGEKLDFAFLDKLDNTKYSWWISLNKRHEPTGIPSYAQKLITAYDGIYLGDVSQKVVYLTFDEGYENGYTPQILDTLKANDVKALFFVTGPYIKSQPELVKRMLAEGHQVGNHTINHPSLPQVSDSSLENELLGLEKQFRDLCGIGFKYMRPPKGEYSEKVLAAAKQLGYRAVFWSFAYLDYDVNNQKGADHAYQMVMDNLHNGAVILLHAVSKDNAEALDRIIKAIRAEGYTISPFDL